ncbi:universal stress protein [Jatrophihabitans sp.]|uniref:universal stress protein n=1 Tax=Jatrophihabitans sp. TaxID=1932789 RepID=UPI002C8202B2|nr:universal stress protein [Jatrophihabitans sp.]
MTMPPVVVGVDDSVDARSAVLWAAEEAMLAGTSLLVVHSPALPLAAPAGHLGAALRASDDVGRSVLDSATALARARQPQLVVKSLLSHADPIQALIDVSVEAQLLVLGARTALTGDVSMLSSRRVTVSAHAHCPVLLLGPVSTFSPPSMVSRIVVGAGTTRAGRAAVAFAAAEAARRDVPLHLLRLEPPAHPAQPASAEAPERRSQAEQELAGEAAALRHERPDLVVLAERVCGEAVEVLPAYSDSSTILVVGCHHSDDHWSTRLGPVATSVVHRNRGPVVVVGHVWNQDGQSPDGRPALPAYRLGLAQR